MFGIIKVLLERTCLYLSKKKRYLNKYVIFYLLLSDLFKKAIKDDSQSEGQMRELPFKSSTLYNGLHLGTRAYVMNPRFSTPTSLPLYFYLGYQVLQENEEFMKDCGKVSLFDFLLTQYSALRNPCEDKKC